ncbi:MAG: calcium/sodium antiporter [Methylococcales bacterium]|jgi:cation:H+ antiporter|nr:calcium/sodium antiporter [Methylococcales bacterium]MBT7445144.1 calcium/sodium antiporter [Methylococcales bacterium]
MLLNYAYIILGFAVLIWGADRFIQGASGIARSMGVSPLLVGLIIVGFGTSAPEIIVSLNASLEGNPAIAIGNALGSNIANIGLVLGATALVMPLAMQSSTLSREFPLLLAVSLAALALMMDGELSQLDGIILLSGLIFVLTWLFFLSKRGNQDDPIQIEYETEFNEVVPFRISGFWFIVGLGLLLAGSQLLVENAVAVADHYGVSKLVIGLTIIAIGTSLPELAASVISALKKEPDIAIGNIIGSNMYNLLAVMAVPALVAPGTFDSGVLERDFPVMIGLTIAMFVMGFGISGRGRINRLEGFALLLAFCGYQYILYGTLKNIVA